MKDVWKGLDTSQLSIIKVELSKIPTAWELCSIFVTLIRSKWSRSLDFTPGEFRREYFRFSFFNPKIFNSDQFSSAKPEPIRPTRDASQPEPIPTTFWLKFRKAEKSIFSKIESGTWSWFFPKLSQQCYLSLDFLIWLNYWPF